MGSSQLCWFEIGGGGRARSMQWGPSGVCTWGLGGIRGLVGFSGGLAESRRVWLDWGLPWSAEILGGVAGSEALHPIKPTQALPSPPKCPSAKATELPQSYKLLPGIVLSTFTGPGILIEVRSGSGEGIGRGSSPQESEAIFNPSTPPTSRQAAFPETPAPNLICFHQLPALENW